MHCPTCDQPNPADARFCTRCGATFTPTGTPSLAAPVAAPPVPGLNQTINVTMQAPAIAPAPSPVIVLTTHVAGPGCLVRGLYFCFIGVWLGALWTWLAWFLLITIIGLPLGLMMLNRIPQVMTLKPVRSQTQVTTANGVVRISQNHLPQQPFWLRAVYFVLVGWWLSGFWLSLAWGLIGVTFGLGLPLAFWMFDRTPAMVTLARQ